VVDGEDLRVGKPGKATSSAGRSFTSTVYESFSFCCILFLLDE
jgi:hypothetical protein